MLCDDLKSSESDGHTGDIYSTSGLRQYVDVPTWTENLYIVASDDWTNIYDIRVSDAGL